MAAAVPRVGVLSARFAAAYVNLVRGFVSRTVSDTNNMEGVVRTVIRSSEAPKPLGKYR